jgi:hypothetical protein
MKTRRNGDAVALYCGAQGCETVYADILPDRVLIYSFHYGRQHSTIVSIDLFKEISLAVCGEGEGGAVECACGPQDCATVGTSGVVFESKHRVQTATGSAGEVHVNTWGLEEIEQVGIWLGLMCDTIPDVDFDLSEVEKSVR